MLAGDVPERDYLDRLLRLKLALDAVYVRRASALHDGAIIARTVWVFLASLVGRRRFADPPETTEAGRLLVEPRPVCERVRNRR